MEMGGDIGEDLWVPFLCLFVLLLILHMLDIILRHGNWDSFSILAIGEILYKMVSGSDFLTERSSSVDYKLDKLEYMEPPLFAMVAFHVVGLGLLSVLLKFPFVWVFRRVSELSVSKGGSVFLSGARSPLSRRALTAFLFVPLFAPLVLGMLEIEWYRQWEALVKSLPVSYALTGAFLACCVWVMRRSEETKWMQEVGLWLASALHVSLIVVLLLWIVWLESNELTVKGIRHDIYIRYGKFKTHAYHAPFRRRLRCVQRFFLYVMRKTKSREAVRMTLMAAGGAVLSHAPVLFCGNFHMVMMLRECLLWGDGSRMRCPCIMEL